MMKKILLTVKVIVDWLTPLNFKRLIDDIKAVWSKDKK